MSFGEFLRFQWQQINERRPQDAVAAALRNDNLARANNLFQQQIQPRELVPLNDNNNNLNPEENDVQDDSSVDDEFEEALDEPFDAEQEEAIRGMNGRDPDADPRAEQPLERNFQNNLPPLPDLDVLDEHDAIPHDRNVHLRHVNFVAPNRRRNPQEDRRNPFADRPGARVDNRFEPRFEPVEPIMPPNVPDAEEVHFELEELLGLRGPLSALLKNFLWLLAFNTTYLGLFAFIPYTVGMNVSRALSKSLYIRGAAFFIYKKTSIDQLLGSLIEETQKRNRLLQLPDVAAMIMGYLSIAFLVFLWNSCTKTAIKYYNLSTKSRQAAPQQPQRPIHPHNAFIFGDRLEPQEEQKTFWEQLSAVVECAAGVGKVGILLFLKMLILPLFLGIGLDAATTKLFGKTVQARVVFFGSDLFGALLIHWVIGISFMLLVTVSVLQLREVAHPELLSRLIRPQEPQPDLLGNLLQENALTHTKRMLTSLAIYLGLLVVHVWIPAHVLTITRLGPLLPLFRPKVNHIFLPQLMIPFELLGFHLCMLGLLEKYKNCIGQIQHRWLLLACELLHLTEYVIPCAIEKFVFVGSRHICIAKELSEEEDHRTPRSINGHTSLNGSESTSDGGNPFGQDTKRNWSVSFEGDIVIDDFWIQLLENSTPSDEFILSNLNILPTSVEAVFEEGVTRSNGQRHLTSSQQFIRLPNAEKSYLSTSLGPYRLRRTITCPQDRATPLKATSTIEFWKEVPGSAIKRPPDGWDDLGAGGAEVQGRWAWGDEKKSYVEQGVARRTPFSHCNQKLFLVLRLVILLLISWVATTLFTCCALNMPIIAGRTFLSILCVPERYIHDPFNFVFGIALLIPVITFLSQYALKPGVDGEHIYSAFYKWLHGYVKPSSSIKMKILAIVMFSWLFVIPLLVGLIYHLCITSVVTSWRDFSSITMASLLTLWLSGALFVGLWLAGCYFDINWQHFLDFFGLEMVVAAEVEARQPENNAPPAANDAGNIPEQQHIQNEYYPESRLKWKGKDALVYRFLTQLGQVLSKWEWDKVDRELFIVDTTVPVLRSLIIALTCPTILLGVTEIILRKFSSSGGLLVSQSRDGSVDRALIVMILYRSFSLIIVSLQLCMCFQEPLKEWFEKAHNAARDERYLMGEILLNYEASKKSIL